MFHYKSETSEFLFSPSSCSAVILTPASLFTFSCEVNKTEMQKKKQPANQTKK